MKNRNLFAFFTLIISLTSQSHAEQKPAAPWTLGEPIVTYWGGPGYVHFGTPVDDRSAKQLVDGGWNLVWCREHELDVVQRYGLRGLLTDPLLDITSMEDPEKLAAMNSLIERVKNHPGLYAYHIYDEPPVGKFPAIDKLVSHLRKTDPAHLSYINLNPTVADKHQLGIIGPTVEAYNEYLKQFVEMVKPSLLSYDHYQFTNTTDEDQYFLNLVLVKNRALASGLPFMNIVQSCTWSFNSVGPSPTSPRIPTPDEMRYLVYTTVAYGAQGISYYVYSQPHHQGGIADQHGNPTELYHALSPLNREFVAIAKQLAPLKSLSVGHVGMHPPGVERIPSESKFTFDPPVPDIEYKKGERVQGLILSQFAPAGQYETTHIVVVNLDYKTKRSVTLKGPSALEVFDATKGEWASTDNSEIELKLEGGAGKLLRIRQ